MKSMKAAEQSDHIAIPSRWSTRRRIAPTRATAVSTQGVNSGMSSTPSVCMLQLVDQVMVKLGSREGGGGSVGLTVVEVVEGLGGEAGEHYQRG